MLSGIKFLLNFQTANQSVVGKSSYFATDNKMYVYKHYCLSKTKSSKSVLIFPGFSVYGYKDQRISNLGKAIAAQGYNVFIPQVESIENLEIKEDIADDMAIIIRHLTGMKHYANSGKIAVLAPSFSAGMLLKAIEHNKLQNFVSSICTIGTFANIESCLSFVLYQNQADDYARNVLLKNFISYTSIPNKELLKDLLNIAIEDNGYKRKDAVLPKTLKKIDTDVKLQWYDLHENIEFRKKIFRELKQNTSVISHLEQSLNVIESVDKYNNPLILIHGKKDDVIPADESVQIYKKRSEKSLPSYLCVTDLLSHGDTELSFSKIKEVWQLAGAFSYFFKYAR